DVPHAGDRPDPARNPRLRRGERGVDRGLRIEGVDEIGPVLPEEPEELRVRADVRQRTEAAGEAVPVVRDCRLAEGLLALRSRGRDLGPPLPELVQQGDPEPDVLPPDEPDRDPLCRRAARAYSFS